MDIEMQGRIRVLSPDFRTSTTILCKRFGHAENYYMEGMQDYLNWTVDGWKRKHADHPDDT